jgi:hypothetical protein
MQRTLVTFGRCNFRSPRWAPGHSKWD